MSGTATVDYGEELERRYTEVSEDLIGIARNQDHPLRRQAIEVGLLMNRDFTQVHPSLPREALQYSDLVSRMLIDSVDGRRNLVGAHQREFGNMLRDMQPRGAETENGKEDKRLVIRATVIAQPNTQGFGERRIGLQQDQRAKVGVREERFKAGDPYFVEVIDDKTLQSLGDFKVIKSNGGLIKHPGVVTADPGYIALGTRVLLRRAEIL